MYECNVNCLEYYLLLLQRRGQHHRNGLGHGALVLFREIDYEFIEGPHLLKPQLEEKIVFSGHPMDLFQLQSFQGLNI